MTYTHSCFEFVINLDVYNSVTQIEFKNIHFMLGRYFVIAFYLIETKHKIDNIKVSVLLKQNK